VREQPGPNPLRLPDVEDLPLFPDQAIGAGQVARLGPHSREHRVATGFDERGEFFSATAHTIV
jgi:hypothetical protein